MKNYLITIFILFVGHTVTMANTVLFNCDEPRAKVDLDVNNVRAKLMNSGDMFWDIYTTGKASYEIPKGSGKHSTFATALWLSAFDNLGNLYTAGQTYRQRGIDFWAGPLNNNAQTNRNICREWDKMFSVYGTEILDAKNNAKLSYNVARWPSAYAPFYDINSDGIYDPSIGDYPIIDVKKQNIIPGQMIFWIFNDAGNRHTAYGTDFKMGIEVHTTAYAFASRESDAINNSTFYKYKIFNKSINTYYDFRVGTFMNSILGLNNDDYMGCDVPRELFYTYNADNFDEYYGINPPAIGIKVLNTDKNDNAGNLGMGAFMYFYLPEGPTIGDNYNDPELLNLYMRGFWPDNTIISYGTSTGFGNNNPCKFMYPGDTDPLGRLYWAETRTPGDRRMISSTNGKTFDPGEITEFEFSVVWAQDSTSSNMFSVEKLKYTSDTIQHYYNSNFSLFTSTGAIKNNAISIYPNPFLDLLNINGISVKTELKIFNSEGKLMLQKIVYVDGAIDVRTLPNGVYFIQLENKVAKFVKR